MFIDQCLLRVLNVHRENDFRLLIEDHCEPPPNWKDCSCKSCVAFHPFKDVEDYFNCYHKSVYMSGMDATSTTTAAPILAPMPVPTPGPMLVPTQAPTPVALPVASQPYATPPDVISGGGKCPADCHTCVKGDKCWEA